MDKKTQGWLGILLQLMWLVADTSGNPMYIRPPVPSKGRLVEIQQYTPRSAPTCLVGEDYWGGARLHRFTPSSLDYVR